jgi:hypothetical protein
MPCDTSFLPNQTITQRKDEITRAVGRLNTLLAAGNVKPKIGPKGSIAFDGWTTEDRSRVTDACAYRRIMATGSALAKAQIARAEAMAGRTVDRQVIGQGVHSHDGGHTWHDHKG